MYNVVYYVGDSTKANKDLRLLLKNRVNSFEYEINFGTLVNRMKSNVPDIIILDYSEYKISYRQLSIFTYETCVSVPLVIVAGYIEPDTHILGPANYIYMKYTDIPESIDLISRELTKLHNNPIKNKQLDLDNRGLIFKTLVTLGFNAGSMGTNYLKECVANIMLKHCNPCCFHDTIYTYVSTYLNTNPANISRCMKVALETAWRHKEEHKIDESTNITFEDFVRCPTPKEFVYYIANKLTIYIENLKFVNMQN